MNPYHLNPGNSMSSTGQRAVTAAGQLDFGPLGEVLRQGGAGALDSLVTGLVAHPEVAQNLGMGIGRAIAADQTVASPEKAAQMQALAEAAGRGAAQGAIGGTVLIVGLVGFGLGWFLKR